MILCSASSIRELFAETILRGSQELSQTELIALAWTLRNRAEGADRECKGELTEAEARELCQAMRSDMGIGERGYTNGAAHTGPAHDSKAFQQALACVSLVFDGLLPDPTKGASRVHPHDEEPDWSSQYDATALIGALLFLRASESPPAGLAARCHPSER